MKIGIITHYYKSENYGGNLQAFALCEFLKKNGYDAEQISLKRDIHFIIHIKQQINRIRSFQAIKVLPNIIKRKRALGNFNQNKIPHSKVFTEQTIKKCVLKYDVYIVGSDQVWHPNAVCDAYLLDFVPETKTKFSYAASLAVETLDSAVLKRYKNSLNDYAAISVREENAVSIIQPITKLKVKCTLDPALLLTQDDWNVICTEQKFQEEYIFCYFLGEQKQQRAVTEQFAKQTHLKVVTLPHILGFFRKCDQDFGDIGLYDISPADFVSLIKYSRYVFTDSFHAVVFSLIYKKEFFVFQRDSCKTMGSRIYSLLDLFEAGNHFCDTEKKENIDYINSLSPINYNREFVKFETAKKDSAEYLIGNLRNAEERINKKQ